MSERRRRPAARPTGDAPGLMSSRPSTRFGDDASKVLPKRPEVSFEESLVSAFREETRKREQAKPKSKPAAPTPEERQAAEDSLLALAGRRVAEESNPRASGAFRRRDREAARAEHQTAQKRAQRSNDEIITDLRSTFAEWTPEQREQFLRSDQFIAFSERGRELALEALGLAEVAEVEPPSPEEVEALSAELDNSWDDDDEEDDVWVDEVP